LLLLILLDIQCEAAPLLGNAQQLESLEKPKSLLLLPDMATSHSLGYVFSSLSLSLRTPSSSFSLHKWLWVGFRIPRATLAAVVTGSGCVLVLSTCKGSTGKKEGKESKTQLQLRPHRSQKSAHYLSACSLMRERHTHMRETERLPPKRDKRVAVFSPTSFSLWGPLGALVCVVVRLLGLPKRMGIGIQSLSPAAKSCANFWLEVGTERDRGGLGFYHHV